MDEDCIMAELAEQIKKVVPDSFIVRHIPKRGVITIESDGFFTGEFVLPILNLLPEEFIFLFSNTEDNRVRMVIY